MRIIFDSLFDLKEFMLFINKDKDTMIKEASAELNKANQELKAAVDNVGKQGEKNA